MCCNKRICADLAASIVIEDLSQENEKVAEKNSSTKIKVVA